MRIGSLLIVLGLSTYLGLLLNSSLTMGFKYSMLAKPERVEMVIPLQARRYTLNIRSELPVNIRIWSAISKSLILSKESVKEETISFIPPVNSVYAIDLNTTSEDGCNVEIWMGCRDIPSTIISVISLIISSSGFLLGLIGHFLDQASNIKALNRCDYIEQEHSVITP